MKKKKKKKNDWRKFIIYRIRIEKEVRKNGERMNGFNVYVACTLVFFIAQRENWMENTIDEKKIWSKSHQKKSSTILLHKHNVSRECYVFNVIFFLSF